MRNFTPRNADLGRATLVTVRPGPALASRGYSAGSTPIAYSAAPSLPRPPRTPPR
jgi:hypothetical protein